MKENQLQISKMFNTLKVKFDKFYALYGISKVDFLAYSTQYEVVWQKLLNVAKDQMYDREYYYDDNENFKYLMYQPTNYLSSVVKELTGENISDLKVEEQELKIEAEDFENIKEYKVILSELQFRKEISFIAGIDYSIIEAYHPLIFRKDHSLSEWNIHALEQRINWNIKRMNLLDQKESKITTNKSNIKYSKVDLIEDLKIYLYLCLKGGEVYQEAFKKMLEKQRILNIREVKELEEVVINKINKELVKFEHCELIKTEDGFYKKIQRNLPSIPKKEKENEGHKEETKGRGEKIRTYVTRRIFGKQQTLIAKNQKQISNLESSLSLSSLNKVSVKQLKEQSGVSHDGLARPSQTMTGEALVYSEPQNSRSLQKPTTEQIAEVDTIVGESEQYLKSSPSVQKLVTITEGLAKLEELEQSQKMQIPKENMNHGTSSAKKRENFQGQQEFSKLVEQGKENQDSKLELISLREKPKLSFS